MKKFDVPEYYRSQLIKDVKSLRIIQDPKKKDLSPSEIKFRGVTFKLARHFGFCYGVENAIEVAYKAVNNNPEKKVYLLSEMIHNPHVNQDLKELGVEFLFTTEGLPLYDFNQLTSNDIVIIPAFGTTLEMKKALSDKGINPQEYNATCPFVEKVWNRAKNLGKKDFSLILHGKYNHEETKATFSHSNEFSSVLIVKDLDEVDKLITFIENDNEEGFKEFFKGKFSQDFDFRKSLDKIAVINQTTMLATETQEIMKRLKAFYNVKYLDLVDQHFADTTDTLCYATYENQSATSALVKSDADFCVIVGGYNSSNTSHLVEIAEEHLPSYFIKDADEILSKDRIRHFDWRAKTLKETQNWLPEAGNLVILLTAGASCPDVQIQSVMYRILDILGLNGENYEISPQLN